MPANQANQNGASPEPMVQLASGNSSERLNTPASCCGKLKGGAKKQWDAASPDCRCALGAIGTMDEHGVITRWNPQVEVIFGWSRQEAINANLADLIIPGTYRAPTTGAWLTSSNAAKGSFF